MMKKGFVIGILLVGILFGLGYGPARAADIEIIMGPSSGFNVVRGTSAAAGTSTLYVGSSTVSVGTTTQNAAMLYVAGSSTSSLDAAFKVGTSTLWVGNDGAVGVGTTTPSATPGFKFWVRGNSYFESYLYAPYTYIGSITAYTDGSTGTVTVYGGLSVTGTVTATAVNAASYTGGGAFTHYVGELYGGGVVFYVYKTAGVEHGLICSVADQGTSTAWSNVDSTEIGAGAQSAWDGLSNSNAIVAQSGHTDSAAKLCLDYTNTDTGTGVYSDWYLPSRDELGLMYFQNANISFILGKAGIAGGGLTSMYYWSSTEYGGVGSIAENQRFDNGGVQGSGVKNDTWGVRAVRAF